MKYIRVLFFSLSIIFLYSQLSLAQTKHQSKQFKLVIDAGHGGKDTGAIGNGGREKDANLGVALLLEKKIKSRYKNVKVIMTRRTDKFIGLQERANIANRNKADLFISIHSNSAKNRQANGTETYVLGLWRTEDNLQVAMRENQSILLEDNYQVTYQGFDPRSSESYIIFEMLQNRHLSQSIEAAQEIQSRLAQLPLGPNRGVRQAGFLVIREIAMPGILIEMGFISNPSNARVLISSSGQDRIAEAICQGFGAYYENYVRQTQGDSNAVEIARVNEDKLALDAPIDEEVDNEIDNDIEKSGSSYTDQPVEKKVTPKKNNKKSVKKASKVEYRIQISASKKKLKSNDPYFKGYAVTVYKENKLYIYCVGSYKDLSAAKKILKKCKRKFKDAYIVMYKDGNRIKNIY